MALPSALRSVGKCMFLGRNERLQEKGKKKERRGRKAQNREWGSEGEEEKWGQPGLGRRRSTARCMVWLFSHSWRPSEGRLMSQLRHAVKTCFNSNWCFTSEKSLSPRNASHLLWNNYMETSPVWHRPVSVFLNKKLSERQENSPVGRNYIDVIM